MVEKYRIRKAVLEDIKNVFDLSNDHLVRANSINREQIKWTDHEKWFTSRIRKRKEPFYIVESEKGAFIGQVRVDKKCDEYVISVSITEKCRGKGIGADVIRQCIKKSGLKSVTAYIYDTNYASIKSFEKAGFKKSNLLKFVYTETLSKLKKFSGDG